MKSAMRKERDEKGIYSLRNEIESYAFKKGIKEGKTSAKDNSIFRRIIAGANIGLHVRYAKNTPEKIYSSNYHTGVRIGLADAMAERGDIGYALALYSAAGVGQTNHVRRKIKKGMDKASPYQLKLASELSKKINSVSTYY